MKRIVFYFFCLLLAGSSFVSAQPVKIACWNLLNYPSSSGATADSATRHPFYRSVVRFMNPDILVTEEVTSITGASWFLSKVMNDTGSSYACGTFINGFDTDNAVYYKTSKFTFVSNIPVHTDLRDISEFTLVHTSTGDTLRIYAVHLKASSGATNEVQRALEVDSLRAVTNRLAAGKNFIVCGDFNIYGSWESAYQKLIQDNANDDGNFIDPLPLSGTWNTSVYSQYHTQSTRTTSFGGGATGGMNDRFDMMLYSPAIAAGDSGMSYVNATTLAIGNDGNHYNQAINTLPNSAAPTTVLNALHNASDHLPVMATFYFGAPSAVTGPGEQPAFSLYPNPASSALTLTYSVTPDLVQIVDLCGRTCLYYKPEDHGNISNVDVSSLVPGLYACLLSLGDRTFSVRFVKQ